MIMKINIYDGTDALRLRERRGDYDGLVTTTRRSFQVANIQVSTVRDGQIVTSRDYHNHPVLADAAAERRP